MFHLVAAATQLDSVVREDITIHNYWLQHSTSMYSINWLQLAAEYEGCSQLILTSPLSTLPEVMCSLTLGIFQLPGVVDSSGLRLWFTPTLRTYDSGIIKTGVAVSPDHHILPAGYPNLLTVGHCTKECMEQVISYFLFIVL